LDDTAPVITILDQPSTTCGMTKTIRAEILDDSLVVSGWYAIIDSQVCDDSVEAAWYSVGSNPSITLRNQSYN
jgi:hypothetical protein